MAKEINSNGFHKRDGKYLWVDEKFKKWSEDQARQLDKAGFKMNTRRVTMQLVDKVIEPNNINLIDLVRPNMKLKRKK